jgi:hypothetical protein
VFWCCVHFLGSLAYLVVDWKVAAMLRAASRLPILLCLKTGHALPALQMVTV